MVCKSILLKKGPGIPLVFLHGFLGSSADWEAVCSYLPPCHSVGVDLPGHGASPFETSFEFEPPAPKFHLIGYSMGGRLALEYAKRYPERIATLIIASAHPGLSSEEEKEKRKESDAQWAKLLLELPIDEFLRRWYDQPLFKNYKPDFSMRRNQNIPDLAAAFMHFGLGNQPVLHVKNAIHIVGELDTKFRALHPEAIIVLESGHVIHLEKPESFAQIIAERIQ
jgi:2-succinyl-6-hydroxy-2,4-cyclohexadiene-1-carboxylate synthase